MPSPPSNPATDARTAILDRIRRANGATSSGADAQAQWKAIERTYRTHGQRSPADTLHLLEERLLEYDAGVHHATAENLVEVIQRILQGRGLDRVLIPEGVPCEWLPSHIHFITDSNLTTAELNTFTAVLTTATLAIAETGTIVLQAVPGQGRRAATLIPDYHLCIVPTGTVLETVVEATRRLQPTATLPTTYFSGPSATADIEMTRIKGVHGPRFLDVILLAK